MTQKTLEERFNEIREKDFDEQDCLIKRGYDDHAIFYFVKSGYDSDAEKNDCKVDHFGNYVRIHDTSSDHRVHLMLGHRKNVKFVLAYDRPKDDIIDEPFMEDNENETPVIFAVADHHENIYKIIARTAYKRGLNPDPRVEGGAFIELKFDTEGAPFMQLYGMSGSYGKFDLQKAADVLNNAGIRAIVDTTRANYREY